MQKYFLSGIVILAFVTYALHQQVGGSPTTNIVNTGINNPSILPATTSYKDGQYTGAVADAFYGNVQVQTTISNGKITDVQFLQYPSDRTRSQMISNMAMPVLKQEAIAAQSANVDAVTGATQTSRAFIQSLQSALSQAS